MFLDRGRYRQGKLRKDSGQLSNTENADIRKSINTKVYSKEYYERYADIFADLEKDITPEEMRRFKILAEACISVDCLDVLEKIKYSDMPSMMRRPITRSVSLTFLKHEGKCDTIGSVCLTGLS